MRSPEPQERQRAWPLRREEGRAAVRRHLSALHDARWSAGGALADGSGGREHGRRTDNRNADERNPRTETPTSETPTRETPTTTTTEASSPAPTTNTAPGALAVSTDEKAPVTSARLHAPPARATPSCRPTKLASADAGAPQRTLQRRPANHPHQKPGGNKLTATHAKPSTPGTKASKQTSATAKNNIALPPRVAAAQAGALSAELAGSAASIQALDFYRIPLFLLPIYQAAAVQYGVPWQILAAINEIETNYGSDQSVSTAGAVGWMQFMPATWIQYGVDALNAGYADPYNPVDAIFAAARYLRAAGAQSNLRQAILAYNHSDEYVASVLLRAKLIAFLPARCHRDPDRLDRCSRPGERQADLVGGTAAERLVIGATAHARLVGKTPARCLVGTTRLAPRPRRRSPSRGERRRRSARPSWLKC